MGPPFPAIFFAARCPQKRSLVGPMTLGVLGGGLNGWCAWDWEDRCTTEMGDDMVTKDPLERAKVALEKLQGQNAELQRQIEAGSALEADYDKVVASQQKASSKYEKLLMRVGDKHSKVHRVAVDMGGGTVAQVSTELINLAVRAAGRWSKDGFFAQNVDVLQGAPHFVLGLGLYIAEMATRKDPADSGGELPSTTREVWSEATKLFAQLGFSNLARAIRVRYAEGKQEQLDHAALNAEYRELQKKYLELQAKSGGGGR